MLEASLHLTTWGVLMAVVLAVAYGITVSVLSTRRVRADDTVRREVAAADRMHSVAHAMSGGSTVAEVWCGLVESMALPLSGVNVRLAGPDAGGLPLISRRQGGADPQGGPGATVLVPAGGAVLRFADPRLHHELVVTPTHGAVAVEVSRALLFAFADHLEMFARTGLLVTQ